VQAPLASWRVLLLPVWSNYLGHGAVSVWTLEQLRAPFADSLGLAFPSIHADPRRLLHWTLIPKQDENATDTSHIVPGLVILWPSYEVRLRGAVGTENKAV